MNNVPLTDHSENSFPMSALRRNLRVVLCLRAAQRYMLIAPIMVPFFAFYGQDLQEIFLLESVFAIVMVAMEPRLDIWRTVLVESPCFALAVCSGLLAGFYCSALTTLPAFWCLRYLGASECPC